MTEPDVEAATAGLVVWKVRVRDGEAREFLDATVQRAESTGAVVLVLRGGMVFGADHLRSALYHARRATAEGRNVSDSIAMETLLYASGERQLGSAIKKMAAGGSDQELVVAKLTGSGFGPEPGWTELQAVDEDVSVERLTRFGLSPEELGTVRKGRPADLVLERVAAVDILKR